MTHKILICGPSWIGDMVMAHSLVQVVHKRFPGCQIDMLAPVWSRAAARFMPEVKAVFTLPFRHNELDLMKRIQFAHHLSNMEYQRCYLLPNSFKSALIPWFARIPERIGWKAEGRSVLLTEARTLDKQQLKLMHHRYAALGFDHEQWSQEDIPLPKFEFDVSEARSLANRYDLIGKESIIALAPGAEYGPSKQWPIENFIILASKLIERGHHVVLTGSEKDQQLCCSIEQRAGDNSSITNLAGKISLDQLIHFLPLCSALICHDSGLMHIAAALDVPLVALYGPTSPDHTPPLTNNAEILYQNLDCSPCFKRECPLTHHNCMKKIKPEQVIKATMSVTS